MSRGSSVGDVLAMQKPRLDNATLIRHDEKAA